MQELLASGLPTSGWPTSGWPTSGWPTMWYDIVYVAFLVNGCILYDRLLHQNGYVYSYYAIHAVSSAMIVRLTAGDVFTTITDFPNLAAHPVNSDAIRWCVALHMYHICAYWHHFTPNEWIRHALMICLIVPNHTLTGFALFILYGLPNSIEYALLFGVHNGWVASMTEHSVNRWLHVWIRSPGCVAHAILTLMVALQSEQTFWVFLPAALTFWNGQTCMQQVVSDYSIRRVSNGDCMHWR